MLPKQAGRKPFLFSTFLCNFHLMNANNENSRRGQNIIQNLVLFFREPVIICSYFKL